MGISIGIAGNLIRLIFRVEIRLQKKTKQIVCFDFFEGSCRNEKRRWKLVTCRSTTELPPVPAPTLYSLSFSLFLSLSLASFSFLFFLPLESTRLVDLARSRRLLILLLHATALAGNLITCLTNHRSEMFFAWNRDVVIFWNSPHKKQKIPHIIRISFVLHHVALSSCSSPSSGWKTFFSEGGISGFFCYHRRIRNYHMIIMNFFLQKAGGSETFRGLYFSTLVERETKCLGSNFWFFWFFFSSPESARVAFFFFRQPVSDWKEAASSVARHRRRSKLSITLPTTTLSLWNSPPLFFLFWRTFSPSSSWFWTGEHNHRKEEDVVTRWNCIRYRSRLPDSS
jgi:hypothetical protein